MRGFESRLEKLEEKVNPKKEVLKG
jgi:hypothetical protein